MEAIWYPLQRVLRTAAQVLVSASAILAVVVVVAPQVIEAVADVLPGPVVAWLLGVVAALTAVSAALSRVMAIPAVNEWFSKIGLGSKPAGAVTLATVNGDVPMTRKQWRAYQRTGVVDDSSA